MIEDPDDVDACLVYADWLQQQGDPRGELIMLQHSGETAAADALLGRHAHHFLGSLAARPKLLDVTWHLGFLRTCRFSLDDDRGPGHEQRALAALAELLAHPSARFLRDLTIEVMNVPHNSYRPAVELIARHDLHALRRLALGDVDRYTRTPTGVLEIDAGPMRALSTAAPDLRTLVVSSTAYDIDMTDVSLPALRELRLFGARGDWIDAVSRGSWPSLVTLEVVGVVQDQVDGSALGTNAFPSLRHLALCAHGTLIGRAGAAIARAPILAQLQTLDLSDTFLNDADVDMMLVHAPRFAHLERLELGFLNIVLTPAREAAVRGFCANVSCVSRPA